MQIFHEGWRIVQVLCDTDFRTPRDVDLPAPDHREAARVYIERRDYPVIDVLEATARFAQPHLLETTTESVTTTLLQASTIPGTGTVITPFPRSS
jgi:hypothetical protein